MFLHRTIWGGDDQYHNFLFGAGGYLSMGSVTPIGDQLEFTGYWTTALLGAETELLFTMDTSDGFVSDTEYQFASNLYISDGLAGFLLESGLADTDLTGQWAGSYSGSATISYVLGPGGAPGVCWTSSKTLSCLMIQNPNLVGSMPVQNRVRPKRNLTRNFQCPSVPSIGTRHIAHGRLLGT